MAQKPAQSATQQLIDIQEIRNGVIVLKSGGLRQIIAVSGVNFDLKSEEEQGMITYAYQSFLNSLDFSVQFFIHSRKLNIEAYLSKLEARSKEETSELLRNQVAEYREFIKSFVSQNAVMDKKFFVVVPFDPIVVPRAAAGITRGIFGLFKKGAASKTSETEREKQIELGFNQLTQRVSQVIGGLSAMGLTASPLGDDEALELFYNLYNPGIVEKKELEITKQP